MLDDYAALIREGRVNVLDCDGVVKGILVLIPEENAMLLDNVAVAPEVKGKGLGRKMLEFAEDSRPRAGYRHPPLHAREDDREHRPLHPHRLRRDAPGRGEGAAPRLHD